MAVKFTAISSGGRDKFVESFRWSIPCEGLAGTCIEEKSDLVEVGLGVDRQVGAFGEELADEAVPVLVGASLPGRVRVAEVHGDTGGDTEAGVGGELVGLVPGERPGQLAGGARHVVGEPGSDARGGL